MNTLRNFVIAGLLLASTTLHAQQPAQSALETVEEGVELLLETIVRSQPLFLTNPDGYFDAVEQALGTIVDFEAVATVVMSRYRESATDAQVERFGDILKTTLTRFYGAALASYDGQELAFIPSANPPSDPRADTVVGMELRGGDSGNITLQYQMFLNESDQWKLKNISLGGINLGRQYYTQFDAAMKQYGNDIDQVLNNWQ